MNKKLLAAVCLAAAATLNTAWAENYTSGDGRYAEPDFDRQMTQAEAENVKAENRACRRQHENRRCVAETGRHAGGAQKYNERRMGLL